MDVWILTIETEQGTDEPRVFSTEKKGLAFAAAFIKETIAEDGTDTKDWHSCVNELLSRENIRGAINLFNQRHYDSTVLVYDVEVE